MSAPDADAARARFAAATAEHLTEPLPGGITIRHVDRAEVMAVADAMWADDSRPHATLDALYTADERARIADLNAVMPTPLAHCLVLEHGGAAVGTYWGTQEPYGRYYMINTIVRPEVRGRGVYSALLARVIAAASASGFLEITSRHRADNNAILVPKLKAGFSISGFEIAPRFGVLVHLRKYCVPGVDEMFRYRIDGAGVAALRDKGVIP